MYAEGSSLDFRNVSITKCAAGKYDAQDNGGGLYTMQSDVVMTDSYVGQCSAEGGSGGGIHTDQSTVVLSSTTFDENNARYYGGTFMP